MQEIITRTMHNEKSRLLEYLRERAQEALLEATLVHGERNYKKRASSINKDIFKIAIDLSNVLNQRATAQQWTSDEILQSHLMIRYCTYVVMLESRNSVWLYDYMTFSRRIGELWEPFCKTCFDYPIEKTISLFEPPVFSDVRQKLQNEIIDYIKRLSISADEKSELENYYNKVWNLITSGEIKLALDLHFKYKNNKFNVDFKSSFQSNEKGNTNRLLLVASIYKNIIEEDNLCLLLVRSEEDKNNHYYQILKNSGIWQAYCGNDTYDQIKNYTGFDVRLWIDNNVKWMDDLDKGTMQYLTDQQLLGYLTW